MSAKGQKLTFSLSAHASASCQQATFEGFGLLRANSGRQARRDPLGPSATRAGGATPTSYSIGSYSTSGLLRDGKSLACSLPRTAFFFGLPDLSLIELSLR